MTSSQTTSLGVSCRNSACTRLDTKSGQCSVVPPADRRLLRWMFALDMCPIITLYATWVRKIDEQQSFGLIKASSLVSADARYRLVALSIHEKDDGPSLIFDQLIMEMRQPPAENESKIPGMLRQVLGARESARPQQRLSPVAVAALGVMLLLFGLVVAGQFRTRPDAPTSPWRIRPTLSLESLPSIEPFRFEIRVRQDLFVSIFWRPEVGISERLFPPLAAPQGLPWPLSGGIEEQTYLVPSTFGLYIPGHGPGSLVVIADGSHAPDYDGPTLDSLLQGTQKVPPGQWIEVFAVQGERRP